MFFIFTILFLVYQEGIQQRISMSAKKSLYYFELPNLKIDNPNNTKLQNIITLALCKPLNAVE